MLRDLAIFSVLSNTYVIKHRPYLFKIKSTCRRV